MISQRILGCLVLILLSQYNDASKSRYVTIKNSLQRIENLLLKQADQPTLNCHIPEKIFNLIWEISKISNNDSNETQVSRRSLPATVDVDNVLFLRNILGLDGEKNAESSSSGKHRNRNSNRNENINTNVNSNYFKARRTLNDLLPLNVGRNRNSNSNSNVNTNTNKLDLTVDPFDLSDEDEA
ncbi:WD repeat-containing protein 91 homolog [Cataglyphis hispanica]|uniref:WD repeat-containing protein 91 homolog n=1 Tax=Cataglyphis hispanica TaxID=1086592 RepID=UPI002180968B|nr:WD repeat-containing protein 91 homolog [Cataglyphis hispanica]